MRDRIAKPTETELLGFGIDPVEFFRYYNHPDPRQLAIDTYGMPDTSDPETLWIPPYTFMVLILHIRRGGRGLPAEMAKSDFLVNGADFSKARFVRRWGWSRSRVSRQILAIQGDTPIPRKPADTTGLVYFAGRADGIGPIKIGLTRGDPAARLKALQTGHPYELAVYGVFEGGAWLERYLHATLKSERLMGEWFERPAAYALLDRLREGWRP